MLSVPEVNTKYINRSCSILLMFCNFKFDRIQDLKLGIPTTHVNNERLITIRNLRLNIILTHYMSQMMYCLIYLVVRLARPVGTPIHSRDAVPSINSPTV